MKDLHLIKGEKDKNIIFHFPTYTLLSVDDNSYNIAKSITEFGIEKTVAEFGYSENELMNFLEKLNKKTAKNDVGLEKKNSDTSNRIISRITLHISNDCNLRCRYCYANGGSYNQPRDLMTIETAQSFVDFCCENFDYIEHIVFFGGEPMMNIEVMEYLCNKFNSYFNTKKIKYIPKFGIITNGTIFNQRILDLIKNFISFITVSIDGPKNLNDHNRIYLNGQGSYDKISRFIKTVAQETNVLIRYEATYTEYHKQNNITISELQSFFWKEFGINGQIMDELSLESRSHQEYWDLFDKDNISDIDMTNLPEGFWSILHSLINQQPKNMCLVSKNIFAISTKGYIYACHMNTGENHLNLGNISSDNIFNSPGNYKESFPLLFNIHKKEVICKDCWAQNICGGCTIKWFYDEEAKNYLSHPKATLCKSNQEHIEKVLLLIANIRKDSKKWEIFTHYCNKNSNYAKF